MNGKNVICMPIVILLMPVLMRGQQVKLVNSTLTEWSGGIAGRMGNNYTFTIDFSDFGLVTPVPDTLWIEGNPVPLTCCTQPGRQGCNAQKTIMKKAIRYEITAGTSKDEYNMYGPEPKKRRPRPGPPVQFTGVALISYQYDGKQKYFVVKRIMKQYPPINYP